MTVGGCFQCPHPGSLVSEGSPAPRLTQKHADDGQGWVCEALEFFFYLQSESGNGLAGERLH